MMDAVCLPCIWTVSLVHIIAIIIVPVFYVVLLRMIFKLFVNHHGIYIIFFYLFSR